jgi:chemotaxis family two-component system response regulator Rcp1
MKTATEVLLVDDNPGDSELTAEFLRGKNRLVHVHSVRDGLEAMAFLRGEGKYSKALPPHLIMLDLNMPRKDGRAVLTQVKSNVALKRIPVVIFTTSRASADIAGCHELGANSYVSKPDNLSGYRSAVSAIADYWFDVASLVRREGQ